MIIDEIQAYQPIDLYGLQNSISISYDCDCDLTELKDALEYLIDNSIVGYEVDFDGNYQYEMSDWWYTGMDEEEKEVWL
jgi:hypothetical protein